MQADLHSSLTLLPCLPFISHQLLHFDYDQFNFNFNHTIEKKQYFSLPNFLPYLFTFLPLSNSHYDQLNLTHKKKTNPKYLIPLK